MRAVADDFLNLSIDRVEKRASALKEERWVYILHWIIFRRIFVRKMYFIFVEMNGYFIRLYNVIKHFKCINHQFQVNICSINYIFRSS